MIAIITKDHLEIINGYIKGVDFIKFAKDIFWLTPQEIDKRNKDYISGKFQQFKHDFPSFCQNLDQIRMDNLLKALNRLDFI